MMHICIHSFTSGSRISKLFSTSYSVNLSSDHLLYLIFLTITDTTTTVTILTNESSCIWIYFRNFYLGSDDENKEVHQALVETLECLDLVSERVAAYRSVTGVLASHPEARDVQFSNLSITFHGKALLADTRLELNNGRRSVIWFTIALCYGSFAYIIFPKHV